MYRYSCTYVCICCVCMHPCTYVCTCTCKHANVRVCTVRMYILYLCMFYARRYACIHNDDEVRICVVYTYLVNGFVFSSHEQRYLSNFPMDNPNDSHNSQENACVRAGSFRNDSVKYRNVNVNNISKINYH